VKKQVEKRWVETLQSQISDFPQGQIDESESPDFLIQTDLGMVGIEVTRIFRECQSDELPEQRHTAEEQKIVDRAQAIATETNLPPLQVSVFFSSQNRPQKKHREMIAGELVSCIAAKLPPGDDYAIAVDASDGLPSEISGVRVWCSPFFKTPLWQCGTGGVVIEHCVDDMQLAIDNKGAKLPAYQEKCVRCWLLIVADWESPASFYEPSDASLSHDYTSLFDRIYFLEAFSRRVLRLITHAI
jgi:hypothetical protein